MFHAIAATFLVLNHWQVALFTCVVVHAHCTIIEMYAGPHTDIHEMARTWNVAIAMTGLRYILFTTQPWFAVFAISLAFSYIEANGHGAHNARHFRTKREILNAATDTALVTLLKQTDAHKCTVHMIALLPIRTHLAQHCAFEISMWLMAQLWPMAAFEIAAMCTWNRTRRLTRVGPLFA